MSANAKEDDDRLKIHEAIGVTALVAFVAFAVVVSTAALAVRCVLVDTFTTKRKEPHDVQ